MFEHLTDKRIRLFDRGSRLIDEPGLNRVPPGAESPPFVVVEQQDWFLFRSSGTFWIGGRTSFLILARSCFAIHWTPLTVRNRTPFPIDGDAFVHDALLIAPSSVFRRSSNSAR